MAGYEAAVDLRGLPAYWQPYIGGLVVNAALVDYVASVGERAALCGTPESRRAAEEFALIQASLVQSGNSLATD